MSRSVPLTVEEQQVLENALAKVVVLGEDVGVSADQMICLLDAGLTVRELLEYLVVRWARSNGEVPASAEL